MALFIPGFTRFTIWNYVRAPDYQRFLDFSGVYAITGNGELILVDSVVRETDEPDFSKLIDLNMLVITGGKNARLKSLSNSLAPRASNSFA